MARAGEEDGIDGGVAVTVGGVRHGARWGVLGTGARGVAYVRYIKL